MPPTSGVAISSGLRPMRTSSVAVSPSRDIRPIASILRSDATRKSASRKTRNYFLLSYYKFLMRVAIVVIGTGIVMEFKANSAQLRTAGATAAAIGCCVFGSLWTVRHLSMLVTHSVPKARVRRCDK